MKKKLLTLALVVGLALSSITASYAASSSTNDRSSSSTSQPKKSQRTYNPVNTGDTTTITIWIILLILGGFMFGAVWIVGKKINENEMN